MNTDMNSLVESIVRDSVTDLLYYDRKECEDVPLGEIERLIKLGDISVDRLVEVFKQELNSACGV